MRHQITQFAMNDTDAEFFQDLGRRIASLRKEQGLTQVELAQSLGVTQSMLAYYETGRRRIPVSHFPKLASALSIPVEALFGLPQNAVAKRGPIPKLHQKIDLISRLPKSTQQYVLQFLDQVLLTRQDARQNKAA